MATELRRRPKWAFYTAHPDHDSLVGITNAYLDCLRNVLASIREMSAWLDSAGWQPMSIEPRRHAVPGAAVKRCLIAHEAHQQLADRKGSLRLHRAHYRLAEATTQALGPFWAVYDYWSQCHGGAACDCEDCTELDAHWRDVEAHLVRHDAYCRRHWRLLTPVSRSLVKPEHIF